MEGPGSKNPRDREQIRPASDCGGGEGWGDIYVGSLVTWCIDARDYMENNSITRCTGDCGCISIKLGGGSHVVLRESCRPGRWQLQTVWQQE